MIRASARARDSSPSRGKILPSQWRPSPGALDICQYPSSEMAMAAASRAGRARPARTRARPAARRVPGAAGGSAGPRRRPAGSRRGTRPGGGNGPGAAGGPCPPRPAPASFSVPNSLDRVEQQVPRAVAVGTQHHRLVDQPDQRVEHVAGLQALVGAHLLDRLDVERAANTASRAQSSCSAGEHQVVAPLGGRPDRLVVRQGRAAPAGQQPEAVLEPVHQLLERDGPQPHAWPARWPAAPRPGAGRA